MALTELTAGKIYRIDLTASETFLTGGAIKVKLLLTSNSLINRMYTFPVTDVNYLTFVLGDGVEVNRLYFSTTEESGELVRMFESVSVIAIMPEETITVSTDGYKLLDYASVYAPGPAIQLGPDPASYDVTNPDFAPIQQSIRVGGFYVDSNSLIGGKTWDESGYPVRTWGDDGTVLVCTGTTQSKAIAGSEEESGWCFVAGSRFGVNTQGNLYANDAHLQGTVTAQDGEIGGFTLSATSISHGNAETDPQCIKLSSDTGTGEYPLSIDTCFANTIGPWRRDPTKDTATSKCYVVEHDPSSNYELYVLRLTDLNYFNQTDAITYTMECTTSDTNNCYVYDTIANSGLAWDYTQVNNTTKNIASGTVVNGSLSGEVGSYTYIVFKPTNASCSAEIHITEPVYVLSKSAPTATQNFRRCENLDFDDISVSGSTVSKKRYACYLDLSTLVDATNENNFIYGDKIIKGGTTADPSVLKITFTKAVDTFDIILSGETYQSDANCVIASTVNASSIPTNPTGANVEDTTYSHHGNVHITYTNIAANDYIYIVSLNAIGEAQKVFLRQAEYLTSTQNLVEEINDVSYFPLGTREKAFDTSSLKCFRLPFYNSASNTSSIQLTANEDLKALNIYLRCAYEPEVNWTETTLSPSLMTSELCHNTPAIWPDHIADENIESIATACFNQRYSKDILKANHSEEASYSIADYKKVTYNNIKAGDKITISLQYKIQEDTLDATDKVEKSGGYILLEPIIGENIFTPSPDFYAATHSYDGREYGFNLLDSNDDQPAELKTAIANYIEANETNPDFFINTLKNYTTFINTNITGGNWEALHFSKDIGALTLYLYTSSANGLTAVSKVNGLLEPGLTPSDITDLDFLDAVEDYTLTPGVLKAVTYFNIKAGDSIIFIHGNTTDTVGAVLVPSIANDPENCLLQLGQKFGATDAGKLICTNGELGTALFDNTGIILGKTNIQDNLNPGTYVGRDGIITDALRITETGGSGTSLDKYKYKISYAPFLYNDSTGTTVTGKVYHSILPNLSVGQSTNIYFPTGSRWGSIDYSFVIDEAVSAYFEIKKLFVNSVQVGWSVKKLSSGVENQNIGYYILYR